MPVACTWRVYRVGQLAVVVSLTTDGGRITRIDIVQAPDKLLGRRTG